MTTIEKPKTLGELIQLGVLEYFERHPDTLALNMASATGIAASRYVEASDNNSNQSNLPKLIEEGKVPRLLRAMAEQEGTEIVYVPGRTDMVTTTSRLDRFGTE